MTKFLSESNEIISADFRIKSVRDNFTHMRRYLVCFYYPEDKETPEYERSEETGHTLASFPETPEGHACANDLVRWIWSEMVKGNECISIPSKRKAPEAAATAQGAEK